MEKMITSFYEKNFSSKNPNSGDIEEITKHVQTLVDHEANDMLDAPFSTKEVKEACFELNPSKAPGKDGFTALFYQNSWETVGEDVTKFALDILNNGGSLQEWNPTLVTLIQKIKNAKSIKDFRPISLCNVLYKVVARAITNRMKGTLGDIIDPHQSAFIPGRAISDNIILGFKCMHWLCHSTSKQGYLALKLDMSKAYDRVEWGYFKAILLAIGFSHKWVRLIMECVTTVTYAFKVNGKISDPIRPSRGLRQGDPLSPYLFVLCAQGLSSLICHWADRNFINGVKIARSSPAISHLFFADDSLIFFKANRKNCEAILKCLKIYEKGSGQLINFEKLAITFSKHTSPDNISFVKNKLGLSVCQGHDLYLGLPTFLG